MDSSEERDRRESGRAFPASSDRGRGNLWRSSILRVLRSAALIYISVCLIMFLLQRRLQYLPDPSEVPLPEGKRYAALAEVTLEASDGIELKAWHWPPPRSGRPTLVLFHGNAGHRGHRLAWMEAMRERGLGAFVLDYRGYGGSEGSPSESGLYRDGEAAVDWLRSHGEGPLIYVGNSLGSAVAVETAVRRPPAGLVLQSAFSSAVDVARGIYFFLPVDLLMRDKFKSIERIGRLECPLLVIHGAEDAQIDPRLGQRLYEAAPQPKRWLEIPQAGHNDLTFARGGQAVEAIAEFAYKLLEREG